MSDSLFCCPVCGEKLNRDPNTYRCPKRHAFDVASSGHVNLLPANKKNSRAPGDDADMVKAREIFLSAGYYSPLRETLFDLILSLTKGKSMTLTDIGCGEGYYTQRFAEIPELKVAAFDISKTAVMKAAKRLRCKENRDTEAAVASAFDIPIASGSTDIALNVFAPLELKEISRILTAGGYFIYVVPGENHLWEMKSVIYDDPYKNKEISPQYDGFEYLGKHEVREIITLSDPAHINALFAMTPYFWHTPKRFTDRLSALSTLTTAIEFDIHVYRKI